MPIQFSCAITLVTLKPFKSAAYNEAAKISIFSKDLPELGYDQMASLVADMGFDGIDLTVRPGGHVLPENVARDLPNAIKAAKQKGLNIYMITTDIWEADDPFTEPILKTAASLGIQYYRMGRRFYDEKKSIANNLETFKTAFKKLAKLNQKYHIRGECQNHSGGGFGAPLWDILEVIKIWILYGLVFSVIYFMLLLKALIRSQSDLIY